MVATDAVYPNNNTNYLNIGSEYSYRNLVHFRAGYSHLFLNDDYGLGHLRMGIGISVQDKITMNYAYSDRAELGAVSTIGVNLHF